MYLRLSALALATALPFSAQAATVSSVEVISVLSEAPFSSLPPIIDDSSASASPGTASVAIGGFSGDSVNAVQNADGTSTVEASTRRDANTELSTAIATFTQDETNMFGMNRDYTLDYSLQGLTTRLFHNSDQGLFGGPAPVFVNPFADDFEALTFTNYTGASFEYLITVNGDEVFSARADILQNEAGRSTENVSNFTVNLTEVSGSQTLVELDAISGTIDLGMFADGETLIVESTLIARSYATNIFDEITNSVGARSSDPVGVSSVGTLSSTPSAVSAVPLPAAGWMLIAGVGGLVAAGRRRKQG